MHALYVLLVSSVQTSSPSTSFLPSDSTNEGLDITSSASLGVSSTPDEEQPKQSNVSPSVFASSPTTGGNIDRTTNSEQEVETTTENPEILTMTVPNERTTDDLMKYSSVKSTEKSELEIKISERTTKATSSSGITESYSTKVEILKEETTSQASRPDSTEIYTTLSENEQKLKTTLVQTIEQTSTAESIEDFSTKMIERVKGETTSPVADTSTSREGATTEGHTTKSEERLMPKTTSQIPIDEISTKVIESAVPETSSQGTELKTTETDGHTTKSLQETMFRATSETPRDHKSLLPITEGLSTKDVERVILEVTSQTNDIKTSEPAETGIYSRTSAEKSMLETTSEPPVIKTLQPGTTDMSSDTTNIFSPATNLKTSRPAESETYSTRSEEKSMLPTTSESSIGQTSYQVSTEGSPHRGVSPETYSTMSERKPMPEATSAFPIDVTSHAGIAEGLSTKSEGRVMMETTSQAANAKISEPDSTERYSTRYESNNMIQVTTEIESETASQNLIAGTSESAITEGSPTKTMENPMEEATKGPAEQEMYTSEAGKKISGYYLDFSADLRLLRSKHSLKVMNSLEW